MRPVQAHRSEQKLMPGEVVPVDVAIYPTSKLWHKGQQLRLRIAGRHIRENWFDPFAWDTDNAGRHVIHIGGSRGAGSVQPAPRRTILQDDLRPPRRCQ
jgi:uncharacterized protein